MDTCLTRHCEGVACETLRSELRLHSVPGYRIDTKSKKNEFTHTSGCQKRHCTVLTFLLYKQFILMCTNKSDEISIVCQKREVYELIGCTKFYGMLKKWSLYL